jgi:dienelactone hydrolase
MIQTFTVLKPITLGLIGLFTLCHADQRARSAERVQFERARYQVGPLQLRLARERGETVTRPPADVIDGYLTKPNGAGPFAAIVHLHGCNGLPNAVKAGAANEPWSERLAGWGYVVLVVDSFTTRGIAQGCSGSLAPRTADAYGALAWLSRQTFVDAGRIAVIGFSQGANTTLAAVDQHDFELFDRAADQTFKAAIAFYPSCSSDGSMTVPTLILIGEADDWTRASACTAMMARRSGAGSPVRLIVYPGAHHAFDVETLRPGRDYFGYRVEYNAAAAEAATEEARRFLAQQLGR